jgi:hypothetical protein
VTKPDFPAGFPLDFSSGVHGRRVVWIRGKEILHQYGTLTEAEIVDLCAKGILKPLQETGLGSADDPDGLKGWRVFPTANLEVMYTRLCKLHRELKAAEERKHKSDETLIGEHDAQLIEQQNYFDKYPERKETTGSVRDIETFKTFVLPEWRQTDDDFIRLLPPEIKKLKEKLAAARVWRNIDAAFEDVCAILMDAFFKDDEVMAVQRTTTPVKRKSSADRELARIRAKAYLEDVPSTSLAEMTRKLQALHENQPRKPLFSRAYTEDTITEWIRDLFPDHTPGKRGRKKKPT